VEVLGPASLRKKVAGIARDMLGVYQST